MAANELEEKALAIAEYLGCNGPELWSEISPLIESEKVKARIEELERPSDYSDLKWFSEYRKERLEELKKGGTE